MKKKVVESCLPQARGFVDFLDHGAMRRCHGLLLLSCAMERPVSCHGLVQLVAIFYFDMGPLLKEDSGCEVSMTCCGEYSQQKR